ncbi:hypothetical protein [Clostridium sp. ZBS2]|uniref:hypothetical protein n=1 Tax=Clostridium sp. ZBS2 TaxID=2949976 RepID=UPI00207992D6|nr:hypothetical protein [Clostridium sp. ZBS2]
MAKVNYLNQASFDPTDSDCDVINQVPIIIKSETKVFSYKYVYSEADCDCRRECYPGKGDDVGFTLIFGNYGEENYCPDPATDPTVHDILDLSQITNASLKVMSICADCHFKIYDVTDPANPIEVTTGTEFMGGSSYTLEIRKCDDNDQNCTAAFCLPCHSVFCLSILFQIEFEGCINDSE